MRRRRCTFGRWKTTAAAAGSLLACADLRAQTLASWMTAINGTWTNAARWSTNPNFPNNGTPTASSTYSAALTASGSPYTVTLASNVTVNLVTLNSASVTMNQTGGMLQSPLVLSPTPGNTSRYHLSGGTLIVNDLSYLGGFRIGANPVSGPAGNGTFELSGSGFLDVTGNEEIGETGAGTFIQTGGTHRVDLSHSMIVGRNAGASGTYSLSGGTLNVAGNEVIGSAGAGTFLQTGGTHVVGSNLFLANAIGSSAHFTASGGTLSAGQLYIGGDASSAGGSASLNINTGAMANVASRLQIWNTGTLTLAGGALNGAPVNYGTFNFSSGTLTGADLSNFSAITQTGGTGTFSGRMNVAQGGTYTLSAGKLTTTALAVGGSLFGADGSGVVNVSGGDLLSTGTLKVWNTGTVNLSSGTLTVGQLNVQSPANFNWTGGTITIAGPGSSQVNNLIVGPGRTLKQTNGSVNGLISIGFGGGQYIMTGGTLTALLSVGAGGVGTFNQSGGVVSIPGITGLTIGTNSIPSPGNGTYRLSGGSLNTPSLTVGNANTTGLFVQTGGTVFTPFLGIGTTNNATAIYTLSGGTLIAGTATIGPTTLGGPTLADLTINPGGTAILNQIVRNTTGVINLAGGTLRTNSITNNGSTINFTAGTLDLGVSGAALNNGLTAALGSSISLGAGKAVVLRRDDVLGDASPATLNLSGGTLISQQVLTVGTGSNAGTLAITSGRADLANVLIGGGGTLNASGGSTTISQTLSLGASSSVANITSHVDVGSLDLGAGTINVGTAGELSANAMGVSGGFVTVVASANAGRLIVGPGGLTLSGTGSPSIALASSGGGSSPGALELSGNLRSIVTSGTSAIVNTGVGTTLGKIDLTGGVRTFTVDNGSAATDMSISAAITNGGIIKDGPGALQITGPISGTQGITLSNGTLDIAGSQAFSGGVLLAGGTLRVTADNSLGSAGNAITFSGGALQLDGSFTTARTFGSGTLGGAIDITEGNTVTSTAGITGSGSCSKRGGGLLRLQGSSSFSGALHVVDGTIGVSDGGLLRSVSSVAASNGAMFRLNNGADNDNNRINDNANVILDGGTFRLVGFDGGITSETAKMLIPNSGASAMSVEAGTSGNATMTFSGGLGTRGNGATLDFQPADSASRIYLTGQGAGFIGGWATVNGTSFAKYNGTGVTALVAGDYDSDFSLGGNVKITSSPGAINIARTVNSLTMDASTSPVGITINNTGTLTLTSGGLLKFGANAGTISGAGVLRSGSSELFAFVDAGGALTISAEISQSVSGAAFAKSGEGTLTLGAGASDTTANTYGGTTFAHRGMLELNKAAGTNAIPGDLTIDGGTVRSLQANQIVDGSTVVVNSGTLDLNGKNETIFNLRNFGGTIITGGGTLTITSPSTMNLSGGTTTISTGRTIAAAGLIVGGGDNTIETSAVVNVGSGGFAMTTSQGPNPTLFLTAHASTPGTLGLDPGANLTFSGTSGMANLGGNSVAGKLELNAASHTFSVNDGTGSIDMLITANIANGGFSKSGAGTLRLTGSNTYSLGTTITGGMIEAGSANALGSGTVTLAGGSLALRSDGFTTAMNNRLTTGGATIDIGRFTAGNTGRFSLGTLSIGTNTLVVTGTSGGTLEFSGASLTGAPTFDPRVAVSINGPISGNFALNKIGSSTLTLGGSGANTYTGLTTVSAGTLELSKTSGVAVPGNLLVSGTGAVMLQGASQIASGASITLNGTGGGGALNLNGYANTVGSINFIAGGNISTGDGTLSINGDIATSGLTGAPIISGNLNLNSLRTINVSSIDLTISANITGASFNKTGERTLTLSGNNAFVGTVTVSGGTLSVASDVNLGPVTNNVILAGGSLRSTTPLLRTISLSGAGGTIDVPLTTAQADLGAINGSAPLIKTGSGTLNFASQASNTGGVTVTAGTLLFGGGVSQQSAATLNSGTWIINNGATLDITSPDITTSNAAITLDGPTSNFPRIAALNTNGGRFTLSNGKVFTTAGSLSNTGTITVSGNSLLVVRGLLSSAAGRVDVSNAVIVDYTGASPIASIRDQIATAFAAGAWTGVGIGSSLAAANANTTSRTALGYAEKTAITLPSYQGQTLDPSSILIRYTLSGDANLDQIVNTMDFTMLATNFNSASGIWTQGDYNYDGKVNALDFNALASNFGAPMPSIPLSAGVSDGASGVSLGRVIPEPTLAGILAPAMLLLRRRTCKSSGVA